MECFHIQEIPVNVSVISGTITNYTTPTTTTIKSFEGYINFSYTIFDGTNSGYMRINDAPGVFTFLNSDPSTFSTTNTAINILQAGTYSFNLSGGLVNNSNTGALFIAVIVNGSISRTIMVRNSVAQTNNTILPVCIDDIEITFGVPGTVQF